MGLEKDLQIIKNSKLDIELLRRENEKLCATNNEKVVVLEEKIESTEFIIEEELKKSGEKKIECKLGYCSFREMPDKFEYDIPKLIHWANEDEVRRDKYVKVVEEFKKAQLKKDYAEGIITHDDVCDEGLTITPQSPKFNYKVR